MLEQVLGIIPSEPKILCLVLAVKAQLNNCTYGLVRLSVRFKTEFACVYMRDKLRSSQDLVVGLVLQGRGNDTNKEYQNISRK